jgi:hypothetical protein
MKRLLLSLLVIAALFSVAGAQSLELIYQGEVFPHGGTITMAGDPYEDELIVHMVVKNIAGQPADVFCRKIEIDVIGGTSNYYCWNACFAPFIYLSPISINLQPGESTEEFSGHYQPFVNAGITQMIYSFFDAANPNDSTYFYVNYFASSVGINETISTSPKVSNAYPNPASTQVSFDYNMPSGVSSASINIHNLLGVKVKEVSLYGFSGKATIDLMDLKEGIYFYSIQIDNQVTETKRLIISR